MVVVLGGVRHDEVSVDMVRVAAVLISLLMLGRWVAATAIAAGVDVRSLHFMDLLEGNNGPRQEEIRGSQRAELE